MVWQRQRRQLVWGVGRENGWFHLPAQWLRQTIGLLGGTTELNLPEKLIYLGVKIGVFPANLAQ